MVGTRMNLISLKTSCAYVRSLNAENSLWDPKTNRMSLIQTRQTLISSFSKKLKIFNRSFFNNNPRVKHNLPVCRCFKKLKLLYYQLGTKKTHVNLQLKKRKKESSRRSLSTPNLRIHNHWFLPLHSNLLQFCLCICKIMPNLENN